MKELRGRRWGRNHRKSDGGAIKKLSGQMCQIWNIRCPFCSIIGFKWIESSQRNLYKETERPHFMIFGPDPSFFYWFLTVPERNPRHSRSRSPGFTCGRSRAAGTPPCPAGGAVDSMGPAWGFFGWKFLFAFLALWKLHANLFHLG